MKKQHLIFLVLMISAVSVHSQSAEFVSKSNVSRLKIDFEIRGSIHIDTAVVNSINLDNYEQYRQKDARVEIYDVQTSYTLTLYSLQEADIKRAQLWPLQQITKPNETQQKFFK